MLRAGRAPSCLLLGAGVLLLASWRVAAQGTPSGPTARDGIYTDAQADRGSDAYATACAHCHASDLQGDVRKEIPALAENDFFVRWGNRSLEELFETMSKEMPADRPGALSAKQYVDILAYILQVNRFPAGTSELVADEVRLKAVTLGSPSEQ